MPVLVQGLLLDLDMATLTVWLNGVRKGVAVYPGMTSEDDEPLARLEGPLRWAVELQEASIGITRPLALPE